MKVASIQLAYTYTRSKEETVAHALGMMDRCKGCDLILLPELWNIGFLAYDSYRRESEPLDGPTARAVAAKAKEFGAYVHGGSFVESRGGNYYNTSVFFDRKGERIAEYRKIHLFTHSGSREPELLSPGSDLVVVETEFGKAGLATCYDLRFPELFRKLTDMGAEMFLVTSCWSDPRDDDWDLFNRARALENTAWLISCDAAGGKNGMRHTGRSKIVSPWGTVVANSDYRETIVTAEIDPLLTRRVRQEYPVLKDRVLG